MSAVRFAIAGGVLAALVLLGYLVYRSIGPGLESHYLTTETFRRLETADRTLNDEILRARLSLSADYDALAALFPRIRNLASSLQEGPQALSGRYGPRVDRALSEYIELMESKEDVTERFKSHNSILRNSINYVPVGGAALETRLRRSKTTELSEPLADLIRAVLEYNLLGTNSARTLVASQVGELSAIGEGLPEGVSATLSDILNHARTLLREKPLSDSLLNDAVSMPTPQYLNSVRDGYLAAHEAKQNEAGLYRWLLAALSVLFLAAAAYLALRMRGSYQQIKQANLAASEANKSLQDRTEQLKGTLATLKRSQSHLVHSEKMSTLGQMVAGVSHEINTPLGYVSSNVELVGENLEQTSDLVEKYELAFQVIEADDTTEGDIDAAMNLLRKAREEVDGSALLGQSRELMGDAREGLQQIGGLVANMKDFARLDREAFDQYDVNAGIDSALKLAHHAIKDRLDVQRDFSELPMIECSPAQINQVFLNLINNAAQAVGDGGKLYIATRHVPEKKLVVIAFQDNGAGIPKEQQAHIFEPFYTTKPYGEGTGLGLSIAHKIISDHRGAIRVTSSEGKGTRFLVTLRIKLPMRNKSSGA